MKPTMKNTIKTTMKKPSNSLSNTRKTRSNAEKCPDLKAYGTGDTLLPYLYNPETMPQNVSDALKQDLAACMGRQVKFKKTYVRTDRLPYLPETSSPISNITGLSGYQKELIQQFVESLNDQIQHIVGPITVGTPSDPHISNNTKLIEVVAGNCHNPNVNTPFHEEFYDGGSAKRLTDEYALVQMNDFDKTVFNHEALHAFGLAHLTTCLFNCTQVDPKNIPSIMHPPHETHNNFGITSFDKFALGTITSSTQTGPKELTEYEYGYLDSITHQTCPNPINTVDDVIINTVDNFFLYAALLSFTTGLLYEASDMFNAKFFNNPTKASREAVKLFADLAYVGMVTACAGKDFIVPSIIAVAIGKSLFLASEQLLDSPTSKTLTKKAFEPHIFNLVLMTFFYKKELSPGYIALNLFQMALSGFSGHYTVDWYAFLSAIYCKGSRVYPTPQTPPIPTTPPTQHTPSPSTSPLEEVIGIDGPINNPDKTVNNLGALSVDELLNQLEAPDPSIPPIPITHPTQHPTSDHTADSNRLAEFRNKLDSFRNRWREFNVPNGK
ncbi:hypothetical protein DID78_06950 [Candidatus Marinamargulisbacteria bacterium SCGC AG-343-D04]|nr:hypothetical protein DID78_06950 [Candidatus Marinamargulisbacteria bacterium SCGC AG-343-D04]